MPRQNKTLRGSACRLSMTVTPFVVTADIPSKKEANKSSSPVIQYGIPASAAHNTQENVAVATPSRLVIVCEYLSNRA